MHAPRRPELRSPIPIETLLLAYRSGIFPMADHREDQEIFWVEPRERAIFPLDGLHVSKSLRKVLRSDRFTVTFDQEFEAVMRACAAPRPGHPESWISERIVESYIGLHKSGHAHSIECWAHKGEAGERLVGGLYGVAFDSVFCGESMFSLSNNASKVALCWLVACLKKAGFKVLDCQFMTDHLASMGAVELPQKAYLKLVELARTSPELDLPEAFARLTQGDTKELYSSEAAGAGAGTSSPGKRIAQSFTQTS